MPDSTPPVFGVGDQDNTGTITAPQNTQPGWNGVFAADARGSGWWAQAQPQIIKYLRSRNQSVDSLYKITEKVDQILAEAKLNATDLGFFKDAYNHGVSDDIKKQLQARLGVTETEWQQILDAERMKKDFEARMATGADGDGLFAKAPISTADQANKYLDWWLKAGGFDGVQKTSKDYGSNGNLLKQLTDSYGDWKAGTTTIGPGGGGTPGSTDPNGGPQSDAINAALGGFVSSMMGPLDPNDPYAKSISGIAGDKAAGYAAGAGITGGLSGAGVTQAVSSALVPYQLQRQQLGFQGLSALSQRDLGLRQQALLDLQAKNAALMGNYNSGQNIGGSIGAAIGGIGDTVLGAYGVKTGGALSHGLGGIGGLIGGGTPPTISGSGSYGGYSGPSLSGGMYRPGGGIN